MATATPIMSSQLYFPPELWSLSIQNFRHRKSPDELTYLWTVVRHVSKQFKEEIEAIFRTEHLPKTWLHIDEYCQSGSSLTDMGLPRIAASGPSGQTIYRYQSMMSFDRIHPRHPGRALFSLDSENAHGKGQRRNTLAYTRRIFKRLRGEVRPGRLVEADEFVPGSRTRVVEGPAGMFVTQVRGSVSDCCLPALNIDLRKHELSFQWRTLFSRFFRERKVTMAVLHDAPAQQAPSGDYIPAQNYIPAQKDSNTRCEELFNQLEPSLHALAQHDWHTHRRHMQVAQEGTLRMQHLQNPIQTWTDVMGMEFGQTNVTLKRCRLRRQADLEIDLDDEGAINQARIHWENESDRAANFKGRAEWDSLIRTCDACRTMNRQCERRDSRSMDCAHCSDNSSPCNSSLAFLDICRPHYLPLDFHWQSKLFEQHIKSCPLGQQEQPLCHMLHSPPWSANGNHALQDYHMQLMLLEQHNKKRRIMAQQKSDLIQIRRMQTSTSTPGNANGNHALQDYNMQSLLLEEQNKKLRLKTRQESDSIQNCGMRTSTSSERNEQRCLQTRQLERAQCSRSSPDEQALDSQAASLVQRYEDLPMEPGRLQDASRRRARPKPSAQTQTPGPTQPERLPHLTDPGQSVTGVQSCTFSSFQT